MTAAGERVASEYHMWESGCWCVALEVERGVWETLCGERLEQLIIPGADDFMEEPCGHCQEVYSDRVALVERLGL